jgi:hypothetical protein
MSALKDYFYQPNVTDSTKRRLTETTKAIHQNPWKKDTGTKHTHTKKEDTKIRQLPRYTGNRDLSSVNIRDAGMLIPRQQRLQCHKSKVDSNR